MATPSTSSPPLGVDDRGLRGFSLTPSTTPPQNLCRWRMPRGVVDDAVGIGHLMQSMCTGEGLHRPRMVNGYIDRPRPLDTQTGWPSDTRDL